MHIRGEQKNQKTEKTGKKQLKKRNREKKPIKILKKPAGLVSVL